MVVDTTQVLNVVQTSKEILSEDVLKLIGQTIGGALAVGLPVLYLWIQKKAKTINWTKEKLDIQSIVNNRIVETRARTGVDRVAIWEFSNSDKTVTGFPFLFITMTFEKTAEYIANIRDKFNKVPASWFAPINGLFIPTDVKYGIFYDDGTVILDGETKSEKDDEIASLLRAYGIMSTAAVKLTNDISDGLMIINSHIEKLTFTEDELESLFGDARFIWFNLAQRPK